MAQSFEIFNVYGKRPEAVENIIQAFYMVLEDQRMNDISKAFKQWMRESASMPTPADILKLIVEDRKHEIRGKVEPAVCGPKFDPIPTIPWHGKTWNQFTDEDKRALRNHLASLSTAAARNYRLYLHDFVGMPKEREDA